MKKQFIAVLLVIASILTFAGCSCGRKPNLMDIANKAKWEDGTASGVITVAEKDNSEMKVNIVTKTKGDNSDITITFGGKEFKAFGADSISLDLKKREGNFQMGMSPFFTLFGWDEEEEYIGAYAQVDKDTINEMYDEDDDINNVQKLLKAYSSYEPLFLNESGDTLTYKATGSQLIDELSNFRKFAKKLNIKDKDILDKHNELVKSLDELFKDESKEDKEDLSKTVKMFEFSINKKKFTFNIVSLSDDTENKISAELNNKPGAVELADFEGRKLTEEEMQNLMIAIAFSGIGSYLDLLD